MMPSLTPAHRRIALIVRSRLRGLGAAAALWCAVALVAVFLEGGFFLFMNGALIGYAAIPLALTSSHRELVGAEAGLWLQKPVREVRFVLTRFVETLVATAGLSLLFGGTCVGVAALAGWVPDEEDLLLTLLLGGDPAGWVLLTTPAGALASFTVAAMAFGATAWLQRGGRVVVVFLIVFGLLASSWDLSAPDGPEKWLHISRFAFFPASEIFRLTGALIGTLRFEGKSLAVPLAYSAAWVAVGVLGVRCAVKRGQMGYERGT